MIIGNHQQADPKQRTTKPIVTGSSVVALTFKDGVILATDTLCSYYSMLDFKNVKRVEKISDNTILSSTGDFSDFQEVVRLLGEKSKEAFLYDDGVRPTPRDYANFLARSSYQKRNKLNPLFLNNVIAGYQNGQRYLSQVDLYGTYVEAKFVTTGFANHFCRSLITNYWREDNTEQQARQLLIECFKVLFCRDARAHDQIQIAVVDKDGVRIDEPIQIETKWDYAGYKNKANERLHTQ